MTDKVNFCMDLFLHLCNSNDKFAAYIENYL